MAYQARSTKYIYKKISDWIKESGSMLPKSPEEIKAFIDNGRGVIVVDENNEPVGFGAQTFDWPDNWKELGAVVVDPDKSKTTGKNLLRYTSKNKII